MGAGPLPDMLTRNAEEMEVLRALAGSELDGPVLMVNVNRYREDSGFPDAAPYTDYIAGLERLVTSLGGEIVRRLAVAGRPVGQSPTAHEILDIRYPNHRAYLDLPSAPGGAGNYELRARCVESAVIHRCPERASTLGALYAACTTFEETFSNMAEDQQRIPNLPSEAWTPDVEALFPIMLPPDSSAKGSDFNSILVLAQHPRLSEHWLRFNAAASRGFVLPARIKEIAILRVAWRSQSEYEWVQHMLSGLRVGLNFDDFTALQAEQTSERWDELDRAVILATDGLWRYQQVDDETFATLSAHFTTEQILELLYVIGAYVALAGILNTARIAIEPSVNQQAEALGLPKLAWNPAIEERRS